MPLEPIQLDDRTFEQWYAETVSRIPVHTPEWTNFNESDPGITLIQLFSFMTENLLYRSNRIPEASRRKFLTLLGIGLQPASPGKGLVIFRNERGPVEALYFIADQEVRAGKVPFRTRTAVDILPVSAAAYYKKPQPSLPEATKEEYRRRTYPTFLNSSSDQLQFYRTTALEPPTIGNLPRVDLTDSINGTIDGTLWVALVAPQNVPLDMVRQAIKGHTLSLGIYPAPACPGKVLLPVFSQENQLTPNPGLIFEIASPQNDTILSHVPNYKRLIPESAENVLETPGIVQLRLPTDEQQLQLWDYDPREEGTGEFPPLIEDKELKQRIVTWIRIRLPDVSQDDTGTQQPTSQPGQRSQQQARLTWVGANAARVIQAIRVTGELIGIGTGAPDQAYKLANAPVIVGTAARSTPTDTSFTDTFVLEIQDGQNGWERWQNIDDLYAARATDKVYYLDPEAGQVTFGSGLRGMRPPLGRNIRVSYDYGGGPDGQVGIGAINKSAALPGGFKVENPLPTWGTSPGETVAEGEQNISRYLRHRDRLVTSSDFRDITLRTPGVNIGRVEVLPLFKPTHQAETQSTAGVITVLVIPKTDPAQPDAPVPNRLFLDTICSWLDPRRLVTSEVYVCGPQYVEIWFSIGVVTMAGQGREDVSRRVRDAIRTYLSPLNGGPPVAPEAALDTNCPPDVSTTTNNPCPQLVGMGWPLNTPVQVQDIAAVASRVSGVRYVTAARLGMLVPGTKTIIAVDEPVPIAGLQLPRLIDISVSEGSAADLSIFQSQSATSSPDLVPVPLLPQKC